MIADTPRDAALTVYSTVALYQIPAAGREQIIRTLAATSVERPVWLVTLELQMEDLGEAQMPSLSITRFSNGEHRRQRAGQGIAARLVDRVGGLRQVG